MLTAAWSNGNCSLSETLLQRVLFLLDQIESPAISYASALGYSAEALANLALDGVLGKKFKASLIPRPARFGPGDDLVVRETSCGLFGVTEADDFIEPLALEEDDRWLYEISLPHLIEGIRRDNGITASGFRNDAGLVPIGTKSVSGGGVFSIYLSLPNENEQAVLARCARLRVPKAVLLVPNGPAFSSEARLVLGDIQVLSLWESAGQGSFTLDWTPLKALASKGIESRVFRKEGEIWTLTFDAKTIHMKAKGLGYICYLLQYASQLIPAAALMAAAAGPAVGTILTGSAGEVLTSETIANYRRQIADLNSEIDKAERNSDLGLKEMLSDEKEQINIQLRSAVGLGGRQRKASDDAEKIRKSVSIAIARAITTIRKNHRPLADHLQRYIDRGQQLSYTGDGIPWTF
jgi:hypothetical protein